MTSMQPFKLRANDRIAIGPTALFLFKNKLKEHEASMKDTEDEPITYDFAADEVIEMENVGQKEEKEALKKAQDEYAKKAMEDFNQKMKE